MSAATLRELVARPELGLRVVVGEDTALATPVRRGYVTDLPDPSRYLSSRDLVLTSCLWYHDDDDCARFVRALRECGAVGVVAGLAGLTPPDVMPDALVTACRDEGLTLLTLGSDRSFGPICETILLGRVAADNARSRKIDGFHRDLVEAVRGGSEPQDTMELFSREFELPCWLLTSDGVTASSHRYLPTESDLAAVRRACTESSDASGDAPVPVPGSQHRSHAWLIRDESRTVLAAFVVGMPTAEDETDLDRVISALVGVIALELELSRRERDADSRQLLDLVEALADDRAAPGEVSARLRLLGADPNASLLIAAAVGQVPFGVADSLAATLTAAFPDAVIRTCTAPDDVVVLVNGADIDPADVGDALRAGFGFRDSDDEHLRIGISDPVTSVSGAADGLRVARTRLDTARESAERIAAVHGYQLDSYTAFIEALPLASRAQFSTQLLEPLSSYDARHGSDLVATLSSFLETCGSWQRSADELQVHVNTLRYRIQRIEELTGRDLSTMAVRVDMFLALRCAAAVALAQQNAVPGLP